MKPSTSGLRASLDGLGPIRTRAQLDATCLHRLDGNRVHLPGRSDGAVPPGPWIDGFPAASRGHLGIPGDALLVGDDQALEDPRGALQRRDWPPWRLTPQELQPG